MRKGRIITWYVSGDIKVESGRMVELGLKDFVPKNSHQTALRKAIDEVKKDLEFNVRMPSKGEKSRRAKIEETIESEFIKYVVVVPYLNDAGEYATKNAFEAKIHKTTGDLSFTNYQTIGNEEFQYISYEIRKKTIAERHSIDANQFRAVVSNLVKKCNAIPLKPSGGSYFIDDRYQGSFDRVKTLFDAFPREECRLVSMPVYDDSETQEAIEYSAQRSFISEIESFKADFKKQASKGKPSDKALDGYKKRLADIIKRCKAHKDNLRTEYEGLVKKTDEIIFILNDDFREAEKPAFNLGEALASVEDKTVDIAAQARAISRALIENT